MKNTLLLGLLIATPWKSFAMGPNLAAERVGPVSAKGLVAPSEASAIGINPISVLSPGVGGSQPVEWTPWTAPERKSIVCHLDQTYIKVSARTRGQSLSDLPSLSSRSLKIDFLRQLPSQVLNGRPLIRLLDLRVTSRTTEYTTRKFLSLQTRNWVSRVFHVATVKEESLFGYRTRLDERLSACIRANLSHDANTISAGGLDLVEMQTSILTQLIKQGIGGL